MYNPNPHIDRSLEWSVRRAVELEGRKRQFVYVLGCDGFVKIGIAVDVQKRLSACQTGNPHPVEFLGMFPTMRAREDEKMLHRDFKEFHKLGEWFKLPEYQLKRLLALACYHY